MNAPEDICGVKAVRVGRSLATSAVILENGTMLADVRSLSVGTTMEGRFLTITLALPAGARVTSGDDRT